MKDVQMRDLFEKDGERFTKFSTSFNDILLDFSKNMCLGEGLESVPQRACARAAAARRFPCGLSSIVSGAPTATARLYAASRRRRWRSLRR